MRSAWQALAGRWPLAIGTYLVYVILTGWPGALGSGWGLIALIIGGPFALGAAIFALSISRGREARIEQLFEGFNRFTDAFVAYLLMVLYVVLWSLLLVIPGIVAALGYSLTFFILADHPSMSGAEALRTSRRMMFGHKWRLFGLMMWFLLLAILCTLTLGIGFLWFFPFVQVTMARFYGNLSGAPVRDHSQRS
jgi:uncharacterized membrane protein